MTLAAGIQPIEDNASVLMIETLEDNVIVDILGVFFQASNIPISINWGDGNINTYPYNMEIGEKHIYEKKGKYFIIIKTNQDYGLTGKIKYTSGQCNEKVILKTSNLCNSFINGNGYATWEKVNCKNIIKIQDNVFNFHSVSENNKKIKYLYNINNIKDIGKDAFHGQDLCQTLIFPKLKSIGTAAFRETNIISISAPSLEKVEDYAFFGCDRIKRIDFPNLTTIPYRFYGVTNSYVRYYDGPITEINLRSGVSFANESFYAEQRFNDSKIYVILRDIKEVKGDYFSLNLRVNLIITTSENKRDLFIDKTFINYTDW